MPGAWVLAALREDGAEGRQMNGDMVQEKCQHAPADDENSHDRRKLHDAKGAVAGFMDALDIEPPEIERRRRSQARR